jgi:hypothetical protein
LEGVGGWQAVRRAESGESGAAAAAPGSPLSSPPTPLSSPPTLLVRPADARGFALAAARHSTVLPTMQYNPFLIPDHFEAQVAGPPSLARLSPCPLRLHHPRRASEGARSACAQLRLLAGWGVE